LRASAQRAKAWRGVMPDAVTPCHTPLPIFMPLIIFHYFASHFIADILMILHCRIFISLLHTPASTPHFLGRQALSFSADAMLIFSPLAITLLMPLPPFSPLAITPELFSPRFRRCAMPP
jgi:hypothetical protein